MAAAKVAAQQVGVGIGIGGGSRGGGSGMELGRGAKPGGEPGGGGMFRPGGMCRAGGSGMVATAGRPLIPGCASFAGKPRGRSIVPVSCKPMNPVGGLLHRVRHDELDRRLLSSPAHLIGLMRTPQVEHPSCRLDL